MDNAVPTVNATRRTELDPGTIADLAIRAEIAAANGGGNAERDEVPWRSNTTSTVASRPAEGEKRRRWPFRLH